MARVIVIGITVLVYLPVLFLAFSPFATHNGVSALFLPVMGWCPLPSRSGEPGYSVDGMDAWGFCLSIPYFVLACVAFVKKSMPLAFTYVGLLAFSVLLVILRAVSDLGGYHNNG
jgi:hypothetical protein